MSLPIDDKRTPDRRSTYDSDTSIQILLQDLSGVFHARVAPATNVETERPIRYHLGTPHNLLILLDNLGRRGSEEHEEIKNTPNGSVSYRRCRLKDNVHGV